MMLERRMITAAGLALALPSWAMPVGDPALRAAVDGLARSAANRARDPARHPFETLRFFGLRPEATVIEAAPGGGWYTEILAPYLRANGLLYAAHERADDADDYRRRSRRRFDEKLASNPAVYDRVRVGTFPRTQAFSDIAPPGGADFVLTFRSLHNWIEAGHLDATLRAFHSVLKPGGVLGVVEHRAPSDGARAEAGAKGYVSETLAIARARTAGFELAARSEINANPRDSKDHPHGVWSLPPSLRGGDVDRDRFMAIGESDRFTHRYVKVRA